MKKSQEDIIEIPEYKFAYSEKLLTLCTGELKAEDFLPSKSEPKATGWDVRCAIKEGISLTPGCYYKIPLGIHMLAPEGWWLDLRPRSSTFGKRHLHALYGVIDEVYPGELLFACQFQPDSCEIFNRNNPCRVEFGDRIGQVIPVRRQEMSVSLTTLKELQNEHAERNSQRTGGFGSSGTK